MGLPFYLAMTGAEIHCAPSIPERIAYMACHFSPYSTGLSNMPEHLPTGSLLTLNDRIPICGHDPIRIGQQLMEAVETFSCSGLLLDLQREGYSEQRELCRHLVTALPCPVAVSELYASDLECPVFLSPPPLTQTLAEHTAPYQGREIWLEAALDAASFSVTKDGCTEDTLLSRPPENCFFDDSVFCRYRMEINEQAARFCLWRTADDLQRMIGQAQTLGVTQLIGLYQQFSKGTL